MSDPIRELIRSAMYSAVDETLDALWPFLGISEVDPVEAKARELAKAGGIDFDEQEPGGVEMLIGMARHVLGQEARP